MDQADLLIELPFRIEFHPKILLGLTSIQKFFLHLAFSCQTQRISFCSHPHHHCSKAQTILTECQTRLLDCTSNHVPCLVHKKWAESKANDMVLSQTLCLHKPSTDVGIDAFICRVPHSTNMPSSICAHSSNRPLHPYDLAIFLPHNTIVGMKSPKQHSQAVNYTKRFWEQIICYPYHAGKILPWDFRAKVYLLQSNAQLRNNKHTFLGLSPDVQWVHFVLFFTQGLASQPQ